MKILHHVLPTILCLGVSTLGLTRTSTAQPLHPTYDQSFEQSTQDLKAKNYQAAEKSAQETLLLSTSSEEKGDALILLGEASYQLKTYEQAKTQWSKLAALEDPENKETFQMFAHLGLARAYKAEGKTNQAIAEFKQVLTDDKSLADAAQKLGITTAIEFALTDTYLEGQQPEPAREQLYKILPDNKNGANVVALAFLSLAKVDVVQNDFKSALAKLNQSLKIKGVTPNVVELTQEQITALIPSLALQGATDAHTKTDFEDNISKIIDASLDNLVLETLTDSD